MSNFIIYKMKKNLLFALIILAGFSANAQLELEGPAPDFTVTDIDGNVHHLQDYLDDEKIVVLDFFATWCSPCWGKHADHILSNLYKAYGPEGSDEIVVLAVECDTDTDMNDLKGLTDMTQGDWIKGTPYPITNDPTPRYQYGISAYPSWRKVCPDRSLFILQGPQGNPVYEHYKNQISGCSGSGNLVGVANHAEITNSTVQLCSNTGTENIDFKIFNLGNNDITNFEVSLKENGTVIHTETFSDEAVESFKSTSHTFSDIEFDSSKEYTIQLTQINGETPFQESLISKEVIVTPAPVSNNNFTVVIRTGAYPYAMGFYIRYSNGDTLLFDTYGDQEDLTPGTTLTYDVNVEEGVADCFDLILTDIYGEGWNGADSGIAIVSNGDTVLYLKPGNFGNTALFYNHAFKTNGILNTPDIEKPTFAIYPNPSNGVIYFSTQETVSVTVIDLTGKVVHHTKNINNGDAINLSALEKGIYIAKVTGANSEINEKIILQ